MGANVKLDTSKTHNESRVFDKTKSKKLASQVKQYVFDLAQNAEAEDGGSVGGILLEKEQLRGVITPDINAGIDPAEKKEAIANEDGRCPFNGS